MKVSESERPEAKTVEMRRPRFNPSVTVELALCGVPTGESLSRVDFSSESVVEAGAYGEGAGSNALRESNRLEDACLVAQAGLGRHSTMKRFFGAGGVALLGAMMLLLMKVA